MNREQSIEEARRVWENRVAGIAELKKRIRAEAEEQIAREVGARQADAARAIHYALQRGATKTALRAVTTKDHYGFEGYVALGERLAIHEGGWEPAR